MPDYLETQFDSLCKEIHNQYEKIEKIKMETLPGLVAHMKGLGATIEDFEKRGIGITPDQYEKVPVSKIASA